MIEQVYHRGSNKIKKELIRSGVTIFGTTGSFGSQTLVGNIQVPGMQIYERDQRNGFVATAPTGGIIFQNDVNDPTRQYIRGGGASLSIGVVGVSNNIIQRLAFDQTQTYNQSGAGRVVYGKLQDSFYNTVVDTSLNYHCYLPMGFDSNRFSAFTNIPMGIRDHVNQTLIASQAQQTFGTGPQNQSRVRTFETVISEETNPQTRTVAGKTISYGGVKQQNILGRPGVVSYFDYLNLV